MPSVIFGISISTIASLILSVYFILRFFSFDKKVPEGIKFFISYLVILLMHLIFSAIYHNALDLTPIKYVMFGLISFLASITLVRCYINIYGDSFVYEICKAIVLIALINVFFTGLIILSEDFKVAFYSIFSLSEAAERYLNMGIRISGMFASGFSILSMFYALAAYLALIILSNYKLSLIGKLFYSFAFILIISAVIYTGRLGLIFIFVVLVLTIVLPNKALGLRKNVVMPVFFFTVMLSLGILIVFYEDLLPLFKWAFGMFFENNNTSGDTVDFIFNNMVFFPEEIFLGTGNFGRNENLEYINSDLGFVLLTHFGGLFLAISFFIGFVFVAFYTMMFTPKVFLRPFVSLILFFHVILNFKDVYLFGSSGLTQVLFITYVSLILFNKSQRNLY